MKLSLQSGKVRTLVLRLAAHIHLLRALPAGAPATLEVSEIPKHKKNPSVGTKKLLQLNKVDWEQ